MRRRINATGESAQGRRINATGESAQGRRINATGESAQGRGINATLRALSKKIDFGLIQLKLMQQ